MSKNQDVLKAKANIKPFHPEKYSAIGLTTDIIRFKIILEENEEVGRFIASWPGLPGCFSQRDTVDESIQKIKEAIQVSLEFLAEDELQ
jgi:predicted RNase H-like HicB family nuclease